MALSDMMRLTKNQRVLLGTLLNDAKELVVCVGPTGSGKTMLACAAAKASRKKSVVFTRPTVVTGNEIGFLPGSAAHKVAPFMGPILLDNKENLPKSYEILPLQHMRGRTFKDSFLLCDEAQNCSKEQLKMLLTRIGSGTKMVVTGDLEQSDLEEPNGLAHIAAGIHRWRHKLNHVALVELDDEDIQRSAAALELHNLYAAMEFKKDWE